MWKKALACILIFVICVSVIWYANPISTTIASAKQYRSGFLVTAEKEDKTGVALDSGFVLSSETPLSLDYVKENVSIRDGGLLTITPISGNRFLLKPLDQLQQNKVYYIDIKTMEGDIVTFAFQTKRDFAVLGSLPSDKSSYVPVDTGIELYFSYPDTEKIDRYFEITPKTGGRFESNGYSVVFIPNEPLKAGTIYTVTVKKGLSAADGAVTLTKDYTFSFETSPDPESTADPMPGYLNLTNSWNEFGTTEKPVIPIDLYMNDNSGSADVTLKVYRYKSLDDFVDALREKDRAPIWAPCAYSRSKIDTSGLDKVMEFTQSFDLKDWHPRYMMFPESLPHGYYLIELSCDKLSAQGFMQISDVTAYSVSDKDNTLFWLNDLKTQGAVANAEIYDYATGKSQKTDRSGLAKLPNADYSDDSEDPQLTLFKVTTSDGKASLINAGYYYGNDSIYSYGLYWQYIQTDRTLYKPNDTVEFWGFIKSRIDGSFPNEVTVELSCGGYYFPMRSSSMQFFMPFISNPLETIKLNTESGFFEGSLKLPSLDPGSYTISVKDGDKVITSSWFSVDNYIKPQYELKIESDKNAVFTGEDINLTIKAVFFDGTPVANIPLKYSIYGPYKNYNGEGKTDSQGTLNISFKPDYSNDMQGEYYYYLTASAELPETGDISGSYGFRVFANDIVITSKGEIRDNKGSLEIKANRVELETLNDDDTTNDNYVGAPISGHSLNIKLYHMTWEKIETGNEYDAINKVVRKTYEYREKRTPAGSAAVVTDADGAARYEFDAAKEEGYYLAEITTKDKNGRSMKSQVWIYSNNFRESPYLSDYEYYTLNTDKESYKANETVNAKVLKNNEQPLKNMRTLFVQARNGIQSYVVNSQPEISMRFPVEYIPNYYLEGIVFNGKAYIPTSAYVIYDYNERKINLDIRTDKDSYRPGDNMTIEIMATDNSGNPVAAKVNLSMVDEALLKLSYRNTDPLVKLYSWIDSGIVSFVNYRSSRTRGVENGAKADEALGGETAAQVQAPKASAAPVPAPDRADMSAGATAVRSDFKDTALFETITLDSTGKGLYTFKLPDNITSFSLAAAAVSSDLYAGSDVRSTRVTMPFFINDALSTDYLAGDKPYVGVTAYGSELKENENVTFEVTVKELPDYIQRATARAFERVNIKLPSFNEGTYTLIIAARTESGKADALSRTITVHPSFRTIEAASLKKITAGTKPDAGKSGITTLIFTDAGRGSLIQSLHSLAWEYGNRIDQKLVSNYARALLNEIVDNDSYYLDGNEFDISLYRNEDGGYGILPYAGTDLKLTALITPLIKDKVDQNALKMYFYNEILSDSGVKAPALFALATLGEPVLLDLERATKVQNLSTEDYIFLGLALDAMGDLSGATHIYNEKISPELERKDPYVRVKVKDNNMDTSYSLSALCSVLASRLGSSDAPKLFKYVENNYSKTCYIGVEKVLYLSEMAKKLDNTNASFEYSLGGSGTTSVDLKDGYSEVIKVPSINIGRLKITKVTGDVSVLSLYMAPYNQGAANESGVTLQRKYYNAVTGKQTTTFRPDDIVKVEITYNIDKSAIDNTYEISDYLPAGLKPVENPFNYGIRDLTGCWYRQFDGQKVTFVVGKSNEAYKPLVYYARVASPGEYLAEGTVAQGSLVKSSITAIDSTRIVIEP